MLRVLHFSDVHLERGFKGVPLRQFMNKRVVGYANLALRRRGHFADAVEKVEALARFIHDENIDISVGTGDYTALGTWPGLGRDQLRDARDLAHTTDFRDLIAEAVGAHLGNSHLDRVLPGHEFRPVGIV